MTYSRTPEGQLRPVAKAVASRNFHPARGQMDYIIGYKLRRAQLAVFQDFIDVFAALRLRPAEFSVLALIAENPGQVQSAIAESLAIKPANLVALIDDLEKRGLAERRKGTADRRTYLLYLTPEGERFVDEMYRVWEAHEERMIARLGGERERDRLISLLDRLLVPASGEQG